MVIKNYVPNHFENKNFKHMEHLLNKNFYYILCHKVSTNFKELKSSYKAINFKKDIRKIPMFELKDESTTQQNLQDKLKQFDV